MFDEGGPGEGLGYSAESDASVSERLREMHAQAAKNTKTKSQMKKDEGKSKKTEVTIADFLIKCLSDNSLDRDLINALNIALNANHSPYVLLAIIELIYKVSSEKSDMSIAIYQQMPSNHLQQWISSLESAAYEAPEKFLTRSKVSLVTLTGLLEVVLRLYQRMQGGMSLGDDLSVISHNTIYRLQTLTQKYINEHRLS